jgi:hypothetical protein
MRKTIILILAFALMIFVHEGMHILVGLAISEFDAFHILPYGFEVTVKTPTELRSGIQWAYFSGSANLATILMGYLMLAAAVCLGPIRQAGKNLFLADLVYWLALFGLIADPLNLSIGPFFYGGDVNGIAVGLEVNRLAIQAVFLVVFLVNRELVAQKLLPAYGIQTSHPLFKPWLKGRVSPAV